MGRIAIARLPPVLTQGLEARVEYWLPTYAIPAALAGAAATCSYAIALRRQHTLGLRPLPARVTPRVAVYVVGISTPVLIVVTAIAELI